MSSLRDLRQRLKSIENIKKITDAMEKVAFARLRKAQMHAEESRPYINKMKEMLENLSNPDFIHPLFEKRDPKKIACIIVSSDKGLSGTYNLNIFQKSDAFLKQHADKAIDLIIYGKKGIDYYSKKEWPIVKTFTGWAGHTYYRKVKILADELVHQFLSYQYDEIWLIYTHFVSIARRDVVVEKFLNIEKKPTNHSLTASDYIFEPSPEEILEELLPRYCASKLLTALYEAYASELAARIMAMQTASNNSKELIIQLTLERNKVRQEAITKEMLEITSGAFY